MTKMKIRYAKAVHKSDRTALINEAMIMTGLSRKYLIRLLSGSVKYRKHKGRKPSYTPEMRKALRDLWLACGQMCPLYLHASMKQHLEDYQAIKGCLPVEITQALLKMSCSTITRIVRSYASSARKANKRSGRAAIASTIPAGPCRDLAPEDSLGYLQVDTVALCGGDMRESFYWMLHITDVNVQWSVFTPVWNRSAHATNEALDYLFKQLPFSPKLIHVDNGSEFINHHLPQFLATHYPDVKLTRSRPYCKNDNNRIEQKNGSIIRALFGDLRFDDYNQHQDLIKLCDDWCKLNNYTVPCRKQISKTRKENIKVIRYTRTYDKPLTPLQRLNLIMPFTPPPVNAIQLRQQCERALQRLYRTQHT